MKSLAFAGFRDKHIVRTICLYAIFVTLLSLCSFTRAQSTDFPVVVEQNLIRVEAPAGYEKYARTVMEHAHAALRKLNSQTGDALLVPVTFRIAADREQFLEMAGGEGEHALAVALGDQQLVIISLPALTKSAADKTQQVLVHELAHIYLDVKTEARVPRWVHEGVAQVMAGEWPDAPGEGAMTIAAYTGGLIPLKELVHGFPADASSRNQAYAESFSAVRFLIEEEHAGSLELFLRAIRGKEGVRYLTSLGETVHLDALDWRWREELKSPAFALNVVFGSGFLWGVAAMLMMVAYFVKRRRSKAIREAWAYEDAETVFADVEEAPVELEFGEYEIGEEPDEEDESWR